MKPNIVEFYRDRAGQHRWRIKRNGRVMADSGEGYSRPKKAANALAVIVAAFGGRIARADVYILPPAPKPTQRKAGRK